MGFFNRVSSASADDVAHYKALAADSAESAFYERQCTAQAERLLAAAIWARDPANIDAICAKAADQIEDCFAFGGRSVAARREALAAIIRAPIEIALSGGKRGLV